MTNIITRNNRKFQIEAILIGTWDYKVDVYELFDNGKFAFCGKAISNNIDTAVNTILK